MAHAGSKQPRGVIQAEMPFRDKDRTGAQHRAACGRDAEKDRISCIVAWASAK